MSEKRYPETVKLTEDMLLNILKGKDTHLIINAHDPEKRMHVIFKGPWDGMFLTHEEISNLQYDSEMGILNFVKKMQDSKSEFNVKSEKRNG